MPHVYPRHSAWATPSPACVNRSRELTLYQPCEQEGFALEPLAQICRGVWFAPVVEERQEGWKCTRAYVGVAQLLARLHGRVAIDCCSLVPLVVIIAHTNPNHGILRLQQPPPLSARLQLTRMLPCANNTRVTRRQARLPDMRDERGPRTRNEPTLGGFSTTTHPSVRRGCRRRPAAAISRRERGLLCVQCVCVVTVACAHGHARHWAGHASVV
jgi:hypothetical protein